MLGVDPVERLRDATASGLVTLRPGLDPAAIAEVQAGCPVPLPVELTRLMIVTSGAEELLDLDLTGRRHDVEVSELLPAGHPVAADGSGNFWLLDLTPDTVDVAPVFFASHDPPVLLYQSDSLATFIDEALKTLEPPYVSAVDDVREDRRHEVWRSRPGSTTWQDAIASGDGALRQFAESLDAGWSIVDLRHRRDVGMGLAWGAHGPRTRLARHGWERLFGYAPPARRKRWWQRAAFADPTMGIRPVRSRSSGRRTAGPGAPPPLPP